MPERPKRIRINVRIPEELHRFVREVYLPRHHAETLTSIIVRALEDLPGCGRTRKDGRRATRSH